MADLDLARRVLQIEAAAILELVPRVDERFDFSALLARLHPAASRVERLRMETPAIYVAFGFLAFGSLLEET